MLSRHHHRELFRHQMSFAFAPDSGGVNEAKSLPVDLDHFIHASRVVPGIGDTMDREVPVSRFSSVDLPTLGCPIIATLTSLGREQFGLRPESPPFICYLLVQSTPSASRFLVSHVSEL